MAYTESQSTPSDNTFVSRAGIELKRAERYRVFVSIVVIDLSGLHEKLNGNHGIAIQRMTEATRAHVRACDFVATLDDGSIGLLFPETPRQGAETAGKRVSELIRKLIEGETRGQVSELIPLEMVSFPDAAGAKTVSEFLQELAARNWN